MCGESLKLLRMCLSNWPAVTQRIMQMQALIEMKQHSWDSPAGHDAH